jgi:uncharacterized membrane-anchored protein
MQEAHGHRARRGASWWSFVCRKEIETGILARPHSEPRMLALQLAALVAFAAPPQAAAPQDTALADSAAIFDSLQRAFESKLSWQQGHITLEGGIATIDVPEGFRFLGRKDAQNVMTKAWGNPPDNQTLGLLFPAAVGPFTEKAWAIEISFRKDGYVKDDEAATIDYDKLLKEMQDAAKESSEQRAKKGFPAVEVIGWAEPPHYDKESHKLYWAKQLQFSGQPTQTLNYNIRALGRRGVLVLNAISDMDQLDSVRSDMPQVLEFVNFTEGNRYADFNAGAGDKVAAYGIAALIAGGVAVKAGLFKGLLLGLLALKKFIVIAALGAAAWFRKMFGKKKEEALPDLPPLETPVAPPQDPTAY